LEAWAQATEYLLTKHEDLSSKPSPVYVSALEFMVIWDFFPWKCWAVWIISDLLLKDSRIRCEYKLGDIIMSMKVSESKANIFTLLYETFHSH
jgi:hypothetical protein